LPNTNVRNFFLVYRNLFCTPLYRNCVTIRFENNLYGVAEKHHAEYIGNNAQACAQLIEFKEEDMSKTSAHKTLMLVTSALAAIVVSSAHADKVNILTDSTTLVQNQAQNSKFFSQTGLSTEAAKEVNGAFDGMSLSLATKIIVPEEWVVNSSGSFDSAIVSWQGGVTWPHILRKIAKEEKIYVHLDWIAKEVNINVPGQTQSATQFAAQAKALETDRADYLKEEAGRWERREDARAALDAEKKRLARVIQAQKEAQEANQAFIAKLNAENDAMRARAEEASARAATEAEKRKAVEAKYAVLAPQGADDTPDATALFADHKKAHVLPYDSSFEYYIKGGYLDEIKADTPATFIARKGTFEEVLRNWVDHIGWGLDYRTDVKHRNPFQVELKGSFFKVSTDLVLSVVDSDRPINIEFNPDAVMTLDSGETRKGVVIVTDLNYKQ
jgi:hypothetical protein